MREDDKDFHQKHDSYYSINPWNSNINKFSAWNSITIPQTKGQHREQWPKMSKLKSF